VKKRQNRSGARNRAKQAKAAAEKAEQRRLGAYGPADPRPDGSARVAYMDAISDIAEGGGLAPLQEQAAREISLVYTRRTKPLFAKTASYERVDVSTPFDCDDRDVLQEARYNEFGRWSKANTYIKTNGRYGRNYLEMILDACISDVGIRAFERRQGMKSGTGAMWLKRGLTQYAVLAKWMKIAA